MLVIPARTADTLTVDMFYRGEVVATEFWSGRAEPPDWLVIPDTIYSGIAVDSAAVRVKP